jgi:hypothetical protein
MLLWLLAVVAGVAAALLQYGSLAVSARPAPLATLRALAVGIVVALLLHAPWGRPQPPARDVALDASLSVGRGRVNAAACWRTMLDSARALGATRYRFGDSLRADAGDEPPADRASRLRPVEEHASATGRPMTIVTDGELDEPALAASLPAGSRVVVMACPSSPDVAVAELDAPRALAAGDTITARVTLSAGARGGPAGMLRLRLDDAILATLPTAALPPFAQSVVEVRGVVNGGDRAAVLRAIHSAVGDGEPRNDTLALAVDITRAAAAVFVSTAPDYDAREAIAAMRGITSLPTRAYLRLAPGSWRIEGTLAPIPEAEVRAAVMRAPLVILHGDTAVFGTPRATTHGSLLLFAGPRAPQGEWFAASAPPSPLAAALATVPYDSLPPIEVAPPEMMPRGQWAALSTHRGGAIGERRVALVGWDEPRRIAVLGASGLWRWRFRGGARADAYAALFGSLFDWLAAGRSDRRAALPERGLLRAGVPVRWRRGAPADSIVTLTLRRRDATARVQTVTLRFAEGASVAESPPLAAGLYDAVMPGGSALLAVNVSRELVPRPPSIATRTIDGTLQPAPPPSVRSLGWLYALAVAMLCAEWLLRRRMGLR